MDGAIRIDTPDPTFARSLARRLRPRRAEVLGDAAAATVAVAGARHPDDVTAVLSETRRWLEEHELPGTVLWLDDRTYYLDATPPRRAEASATPGAVSARAGILSDS